MGLSASKAALGATTDEPTEPEPRHLATCNDIMKNIENLYNCGNFPGLLQYINQTNRSVEHLTNVLTAKACCNSSWIVVFKALVTMHHLMVHGNERCIQHLSSRSSLFTLHNFLDKSVIEGYMMSTFIRRYSRYLNEKSLAYRLVSYDITKTKRGVHGMMRTMNTEELLDTLPVIQTQFDALLNFNVNLDQLTNRIIQVAFMLLFKDSVRLFAAYNEGILNLLDKYFNMRKNQCKESLDIYIKFLGRTAKLTKFLKVAEAPHSLTEALKQHLASLELKNDILSPYSLQNAFIQFIPKNAYMKVSSRRPCFAANILLVFTLSYPVSLYLKDSFLIILPVLFIQLTLPSQALKSVGDKQQGETVMESNLNSSLLGIPKFGESTINETDLKEFQPSEMEISGEMNWQLNISHLEFYVCSSSFLHGTTSSSLSSDFTASVYV